MKLFICCKLTSLQCTQGSHKNNVKYCSSYLEFQNIVKYTNNVLLTNKNLCKWKNDRMYIQF